MILATNDRECAGRLMPAMQKQGLEVSMVSSLSELSAVAHLRRHNLAIIESGFDGEPAHDLLGHVPVDDGVNVVVLTAEGNSDDRYAAYEAGAVGCFDKEHDPTEIAMLARNLNNLSCNPYSQAISGLNEWSYSMSSCTLVSPSGVSVRLRNKDAELFGNLATESQSHVSREELSQAMGYPDTVKGNKALEGVVHRLRATLLPLGKGLVETVHGFGWKVSVPVRII